MSGEQPPANVAPTAEQFAALQKTVSEQSQYIKEIGPFVEDASVLVAAIYSDPKVKETVLNRVGEYRANPNGQTPPQNPQPAPQNTWKFDPQTGQPIQQQTPPQQPQAPQTPPKDPRVDQMDVKAREDAIAAVEQKLGYHKLKPEDKKVIRASVEKQLNEWGQSVLSTPVNMLPKLLQDAYVLTDLNKAQSEGRTQELIDARNNEMGIMPPMGASNPQVPTNQLNQDQKTWTKRWNLNEDKVAERLKEYQETGVMTYKPKEPAAANPKPAPSGTPPLPPTSPQTQ